jgi:hypothetical protein
MNRAAGISPQQRVKQYDDQTRANFYVSKLEPVDDQSWLSLHITNDDAERKLAYVAMTCRDDGARWDSQ